MNETLQNILSRRSVRRYQQRQLTQEDLNAILNAAIYAPSGRNLQTWFFTVVQNQELIGKLEKAVAKTKGREEDSFHPFFHAPTVVFVSGMEDTEWTESDCAAAVENMMLAGESLGIGSCWIGCCRSTLQGDDMDLWKKELKVPDGYRPLYAVTLGYFPEDFSAPKAAERKQNTIVYVK